MYNQHVARHDRSLQFDLANMQIESIRRATHYISFVTHCRGAGGGPPCVRVHRLLLTSVRGDGLCSFFYKSVPANITTLERIQSYGVPFDNRKYVPRQNICRAIVIARRRRSRAAAAAQRLIYRYDPFVTRLTRRQYIRLFGGGAADLIMPITLRSAFVGRP